MNDRSIIEVPDPRGNGDWVDGYLANTNIAPQSGGPSLIDIAAIRGILYRQRWLMMGVIAAAALAGLIWTLLATPMYEARSTVRIEPYGNFIVEGQNIDQGIASNQVFQLLETYIGVIKSRNLANVVAEELNLGERSDFLGPHVDDARPTNMTDAQWLEAKQNLAAEKLHRSVDAELTSNNWIIAITYRSDDPVIAAEMANAYLAAFAASDSRASVAESEYAQQFLSEQIQQVRERLQEAEMAANDYARASQLVVQPIPSEDGGTPVTLTATNLASINERVSAATAARIEAEQRWQSIANLPAGQLPEVQNNPALQRLIGERASKRAELADLRERYNDGFPQIENLKAQIEALDAQVQESSASIKAAVRNDYIVARNQEQALKNELASITGETLAEQDRQVEYGVLERQAQALRNQLEALLARYNQVSSATTVQKGKINPLDAAIVPDSPYAPSLFRNLVMAIVFGAALAGGLAVLRETIDDKVRSLDDIEQRIGIPMLGSTPYVASSDIASEDSDRFNALMEAYASIRTTLDFCLPRGGSNVIQLTSTHGSEGKSTTAVILAELFASLGRRTLLIDGDLRQPSVAKLLGQEKPKVGIVEVLQNRVDLGEAVITGVHENLEILPVGERPSNPSELLASARLRDFIGRLREDYSLVIFDSCPVLGLADAPILSRTVDGTIFILEANNVHFGQAKNALQRIRSSGGNVIGGILTKYRASQAGENYDYQYSYYRYGGD